MTENQSPDLNNPDFYENREISWLSFNLHVIKEAEDDLNPLLERLGFVAIGSSNLDEFMMVRVAGLQDQKRYEPKARDTKKQWSADQQLEAIAEKNHQIVDYQYEVFNRLVEECRENNIFFEDDQILSGEARQNLKRYFSEEIYPTLTPLGVDAYRPFPSLGNKITNVFVNLERDGQEEIAIVPIPALVERYFYLQDGDKHILIDVYEVIEHFITALFDGYNVTSTFLFRVTRNADMALNEEGAEDLLVSIEDFLIKRKKGQAVRLEIDTRHSKRELLAKDVQWLVQNLELSPRDVYAINGPLDLTALNEAKNKLEDAFPKLTYKPFHSVYPPELKNMGVFDYIKKHDLFLFHPYDSFQPVVDFIVDAADDPNTIAIKQTLYRVSSNSPIVKALIRAAEKGKQVTVLVELKARFDEQNNVEWAKQLEEAGCQVIYGKNMLKTHSKITLIIKRERGALRRYVHLGTGNYNDKTAKLYTDNSLLTSDPEITEDATNFFNYLSGYSDQPKYHKLFVSPDNIRINYLKAIDQEIENQKQYGNGHIIAKMNSLTSKGIIKALYRASQAGVKIDLIVRGICCLVPGIEGISNNIRVISVIGRFLEHSRVYYFYNNGDTKVYLSSADLMTRNLDHRVEIAFPVDNPAIHQRVIDILDTYLSDNIKARYKKPDNTYDYVSNTDKELNAQEFFITRAKSRVPDILPKTSDDTSARWWQKLLNRGHK